MARKNSVNYNDFSTWNIPMIILTGLVVIGLVFFGISKFFVEGITQQVDSSNSLILEQESEYAKNQEIVALLPHIRKEVAELQLIRDEAKKYLPTKVSMPSLIDNVYLAARDNGIVFDTFIPGGDIDTEFYTIKPISLSAEVGYLSMSSFIEQVTSLRRIMNVQSVSFESDNTKATNGKDQALTVIANEPLKMTAELRTYIFKEAAETENKK